MLHTVIRLKKYDVIEVLLERDLNISQRDDDGDTPLLLAAKRHLDPVTVE